MTDQVKVNEVIAKIDKTKIYVVMYTPDRETEPEPDIAFYDSEKADQYCAKQNIEGDFDPTTEGQYGGYWPKEIEIQ